MAIEITVRCDCCNAAGSTPSPENIPLGWDTVRVAVGDKSMTTHVCHECRIRDIGINAPVKQLAGVVRDYLRNQRKLRADAAAVKKKK